MGKQKPVGIVGGGLAGIACARILHRERIPYQVFESDSRLGGKLKTDWVEGFGLDQGFQVLFTGYPELGPFLKASDLNLKKFIAGALIWDGECLNPVRQDKPFATAVNGLFPVSDKLKVIQLNEELRYTELEDIYSMPDSTTSEYLKEFGFSKDFIQSFAKPFFGAIFLDGDLRVSARQFAFVWKMLNEGQTVIPSLGIQRLPISMAEPLFDDNVRLNSPVQSLTGASGEFLLGLNSGESVTCTDVVLACDPVHAHGLVGQSIRVEYRASTCMYFEADHAPLPEPIIALNAAGGFVNTVVPVSAVSQDLAPDGRHLVSVTVIGDPEISDEALAQECLDELAPWFPHCRVREWRHIRTYRVRNAQLAQWPGAFENRPGRRTGRDGVAFAGEYMSDSSINGAIRSGVEAAYQIVQHQRSRP